jgi:hypothetical protein
MAKLLYPSLNTILMAVSVGLCATSLIPATAQAQTSTDRQKLEYKKVFDQRKRLADEHCVMHPKTLGELKYSICHMEDLVMKVELEGPAGENGPTAYFYSGRLYAFRDTGDGQAVIFDKGRLVAQVEVGTDPAQSKIRTVFNQEERKSVADRAIESTRSMLKVFGQKLEL